MVLDHLLGKNIMCFENGKLCRKFMLNFKLHWKLKINHPNVFHVVLTQKLLLKFLNEAN